MGEPVRMSVPVAKGDDVKLRAVGDADVHDLRPGDVTEVWVRGTGWARMKVLEVDGDRVRVKALDVKLVHRG